MQEIHLLTNQDAEKPHIHSDGKLQKVDANPYACGPMGDILWQSVFLRVFRKRM